MSYLRSIMELNSGICIERYLPARTIAKSPFVFVHGSFQGSWCWKNFLKYFATKGVSCYAVNLRGHWLSRGHALLGNSVVEDYVSDVSESLQAIGGRIIVIGHGMGGLVCQKVAETENIKKLILVDSAPCTEVAESCFQKISEAEKAAEGLLRFQSDGTVFVYPDKEMVRRAFFEKQKVSAEILSQTISLLGMESAHVLKHHMLLSVDPEKVTCPVFVLGRKGGGNSKHPDILHILADYFHADEEARCIKEDMSHLMMLESDWERHASTIEQWCL